MSGDANEWVSLRQAADILGVHPATVRAWADRGDLAARRTPGGHRRFHRADLERYAQKHGELHPIEVQVIIQNALGQMRLEVGGGTLASVAWYEAMSAGMREKMRQQGRQVLEELRSYLAQGAPDSGLAAAIRIGKEYAQALHGEGLTLPQAVRGFFYFTDFVFNAILTWQEITPPRNPSEWSRLLREVNTFTNTMLLSIVEYYEEE
ncbi:MAG: helix-turn-helix domain-containing protein [Aggregatilineales bacterium]